MSIPKQIERLMKANKVSRYKLSKDTNIPYTTLTQIINGRTKDPQVRALETIADYFNKSLDYLLGKSIDALIENRLEELGMTIEQLAEKTKIPLKKLQNLDNVQPAPWDYEKDGVIDRIAKALGMDFKELASAFARQEPPAYDGPPDTRSIEEIFGDKDFSDYGLAEKFDKQYNSAKLKEEVELYEETDKILKPAGLNVTDVVPPWATSKDIRDFKKMLEEDAPVMFDGVPLDEEDKEKVLKVMEAIFWDAKKKNKRKPVED
jgi:transcriptional regulator with XRE-family HTH domain